MSTYESEVSFDDLILDSSAPKWLEDIVFELKLSRPLEQLWPEPQSNCVKALLQYITTNYIPTCVVQGLNDAWLKVSTVETAFRTGDALLLAEPVTRTHVEAWLKRASFERFVDLVDFLMVMGGCRESGNSEFRIASPHRDPEVVSDPLLVSLVGYDECRGGLWLAHFSEGSVVMARDGGVYMFSLEAGEFTRVSQSLEHFVYLFMSFRANAWIVGNDDVSRHAHFEFYSPSGDRWWQDDDEYWHWREGPC